MKTPRQIEAANSASAEDEPYEALWSGAVAVLVPTGLAFLVYWSTAAPGLTWAHQGADGGDFLAAVVSNGVPHPSGYPLYTILLQAWLWFGKMLAPQSSPSRLGNMLSATLAAASVGVTVMVAARLAGRGRGRWGLAAAVALLWAVSPLFWSQALITEVYSLHLLLAALLVTTILYRPNWLILTGALVGLGIANHLTYALLLPAAGYLLWRKQGRALIGWRGAGMFTAATIAAAALYLRIPLAAAGNGAPPPVNWGYADNWTGFWWLVSGEAYRAYFADQSWGDTGLRVAAWARTLTVEYTPLGLAVAAVGLAHWDRARPDLRTFSLLWVLPISLYAILYATRDSQVYLLPALWMMALWLAAGMAAATDWLPARTGLVRSHAILLLVGLALAAASTLMVVRAPQLSLRSDDAAMTFLAEVGEVIQPDSIVVSSSDAQTFALWYGAWGSGELLQKAPGAVFVNDSLYQFEWYRRLLGDLYPQVAGISEGFQDMLVLNAGVRPIFFAEPLDTVPEDHQEAAGGMWRFVP